MNASTPVTNIAEQFRDWIGRAFVIDDEINLSTVRHIAAMADLDPDDFVRGDELPPHWYSMFFTLNARQSQLGDDGHPRKGEFLPPIPLPRRMFAGRNVEFIKPLRIGIEARKGSEIISIEDKTGRSGRLVFLKVRHTVEVDSDPVLIETQQIVYREAEATAVRNHAPESGALAPDDAAWSKTITVDPVLLFRYSAVTWNGHRIHYDADYARQEEGYRGCVVNGALTLHLVIDAALRVNPTRRLHRLEARLSKPLFSGDTIVIAGKPIATGGEHNVAAWASDARGALAASVSLRFD